MTVLEQKQPKRKHGGSILRRRWPLLLLLASVFFLLSGCSEKEKPDTRGMIVGGDTYKNPGLGMVVVIHGDWYFAEERTGRHSTAQTANQDGNLNDVCTGPFCGDADADVSLLIKTGSNAAASLSFLAYKLSWLDRMRYPLDRLAGMMTLGSLKRSGMIPVGHLSEGVRNRKTAYRLLLRQKDAQDASEVCYVLESNGYTILLVGAVSQASDLPKLQEAIENIKFDTQK